MKKILLVMLSIMMVLNGAIALAQEVGSGAEQVVSEGPLRNVISTQGKIEEVRNGMVRVSGQGAYHDIMLHVQSTTHIVNGQNGAPVVLTDLKKGDSITAYYGPAVTRSLPPQGNAITLVVGTPETGNAGMYMKVASLQENKDGSIRVLCTNNDRMVTIRPETFPQVADIKEGSELMVWYDIMTMSIPAQAGATKVVLLPAQMDIRVNTIAGVIVTNQRELRLGEHDVITKNENTVMLPLRVIAESLGYNIIWHEENNTADLKKGSHIITVTIGSKEYSRDNSSIQLDYVPEMVNGTTLVPVEFFTKVMKLNVEVSSKEGFGL